MQLIFLALSLAALAFALSAILLQSLLKDRLCVRARIGVLLDPHADTGRKRLKKQKAGKDKKPNIPLTDKVIRGISTELSLAGIRLRAEEFIMICAVSSLLPAGMCLLFGADWIVALPLFAAGALLPRLWVARARSKRLALFEQQLGDALIIAGNCLRTGLSFQQAIGSIASDMPEPISKEFGRVCKEVSLGVTLEQALVNMVERLKSDDFLLIAAAVLIQRQVGGNLSEILDSISGTIRERIKLKSSVKVLTATGRVSGLVVGLMPAFLILMLMLINPAYIRSFFDSGAGIAMLCAAGGLEIVGFLAVRKIVNIKF